MADTLISTCHKDTQLLIRSRMKAFAVHIYQSLQIMVYTLQRDMMMRAKRKIWRYEEEEEMEFGTKQAAHGSDKTSMSEYKL